MFIAVSKTLQANREAIYIALCYQRIVPSGVFIANSYQSILQISDHYFIPARS